MQKSTIRDMSAKDEYANDFCFNEQHTQTVITVITNFDTTQ